MSFATDKWFKQLNEETLMEGLADIGLPESILDSIRADMPEASEKGRVWVGNAWKSEVPAQFRSSNPKWWADAMSMLEGVAQSDAFAGNAIFLENAIQIYKRRPWGNWAKARRTFIKNARKAKISDGVVSAVLSAFDDLELGAWQWLASRISNVIVTLNENPNNYTMIKSIPPTDWDDAEEECYKYQQSKEDPEQIIHTFSDGAYWYDLEVYQCNIEGGRMGHCGSDSRGTLYSLRKKSKGSRDSKSYVTISYNSQEQVIYQIKGRSNSCPPEELWPYIQKFVRIMDATVLQESGEHSNDPEGFEELGQYLARETGISFTGSFEKAFEDFSSEVNDLDDQFRSNPISLQVELAGVSVESDDFGGDRPYIYWNDRLECVAAELTFDVTERILRALEDDDLQEKLFDIFKEEDRNDIFDGQDYYPEIKMLKADAYELAIYKANNYTRLKGLTDSEEFYGSPLLEGNKSYIVLWDNWEPAFGEWASYNDIPREEPSGYDDWLDGVREAVNDLEDSVDEIENYLISAKILAPSPVKSFKKTIDDEFNKFIVSTTSKGGGEYDIASTGLLFKTTAAEMETIVELGFFNDFHKTSSGYYTNEVFKALVLGKLKEKEAQALEFAEDQMKLNFGEKYEKKIESLWSKIKSSKVMGTNFYDQMFVGFQPQIPKKVRAPRPAQVINMESSFYYKIEVILNKQTIEFFGPFLEYYDNNFELVTGAFDFALKQMVSRKARAFKKQNDSDSNLPLQEETPALDVRVYDMDFVMSYPLGVGFEMTDIHNIIRAIPDVTTVRTKGQKRRAGNNSVSVQNLKFALRGQRSRMTWVKQVLLPQIHKIDRRIKILKIDRAQLTEGKINLEEYYSSYSMRQSPARVTPSPRIQQILDDWMQGGVMYDSPMLNSLSREHVMVPVEDLECLLSRNPRKHGDHFEAGYQNFIKIGPRDPIYIAVGKNGKVKITGNEDDLRYAIKAGVEEVPVYFSYQTQV